MKDINEKNQSTSNTINRNADTGTDVNHDTTDTSSEENVEIIELEDTETKKGVKSGLFSIASKMGMGNTDGTYNLKPFLWGIGLTAVAIFGAQHAIKEGWIKIGK